jgi:hypothetical protein
MKFFVSAIIPGSHQLGVMQFEAENDEECRQKAENLCPQRAHFQSYELQEFDDLPIGEFISADKLHSLGY